MYFLLCIENNKKLCDGWIRGGYFYYIYILTTIIMLPLSYAPFMGSGDIVTSTQNQTQSQPPKKKIPTMRKTIKKVSSSPEVKGVDLEDTNEVGALLEKMTTIYTENDGQDLSNFNPLPYPNMDSKLPPIPSPPPLQPQKNNSSVFTVNSTALDKNVGDFRNAYNSPTMWQKSVSANPNRTEDRIWDRLGYIVHLLEEQQNEKTENILEEYILYVLLGTFVVFIVDSFSRSGKYVR
jgi:hypothetical protein